MRMQDTAANCGPASLSNALKAVGIDKSQADCELMCKTTATDGTGVKGLVRGIHVAGRNPVTLKATNRDHARLRLESELRLGHPVILSVDNGSHWVAAIGLLGRQFLIADPADNELVLSLSADQLQQRWLCGKTYFGVIV